MRRFISPRLGAVMLLLCLAWTSEARADYTRLHDGKITAYFNYSVKSGGAPELAANGGVDLEERIVNRIDQASASVDVVVYDFESATIAQALARARERGVLVRVVIDDALRYDDGEDGNDPENFDFQVHKILGEAGIPVFDDKGGLVRDPGNKPKSNRQMHNKFICFDLRSPDPGDDWLWIGSNNFTVSGKLHAQNALEIHHHSLAKIYYEEFLRMWGGDAPLPNPDKAQFHNDKPVSAPHTAYIDGSRVDVCFSPRFETEADQAGRKAPEKRKALELIERAIDSADKSVEFCCFVMSDQGLADAMLSARNRGVEIRGVFDEGFFGQWYSESVDMTNRRDVLYYRTGEAEPGNRYWNPPAPVYPDFVGGVRDNKHHKLHHKYMIIDAGQDSSLDPIVITGSLNWSNNGINVNDENVAFIHDAALAGQYRQEFEARYEEARDNVNVRYRPGAQEDEDKDNKTIDEEHEPPQNKARVRIESVIVKPADKEAVTLLNATGETIDLGGWTLGDANKPHAWTIPAGTALAPGSKITFHKGADFTFRINDTGETIYLYEHDKEVDRWEAE